MTSRFGNLQPHFHVAALRLGDRTRWTPISSGFPLFSIIILTGSENLEDFEDPESFKSFKNFYSWLKG